eukprot:COSAG03_NODE_810_length_5761_cov_6.315613_5_plen_130_part_00
MRLVCALRVCLFFARVAVETISREASNDLCTLPPLKGRHKGREFLTIVPLLPPSCPFLQPWRPLPAADASRRWRNRICVIFRSGSGSGCLVRSQRLFLLPRLRSGVLLVRCEDEGIRPVLIPTLLSTLQ